MENTRLTGRVPRALRGISYVAGRGTSSVVVLSREFTISCFSLLVILASRNLEVSFADADRTNRWYAGVKKNRQIMEEMTKLSSL